MTKKCGEHQTKVSLHEFVVFISKCAKLVIECSCFKNILTLKASVSWHRLPSPMESMVARESHEATFITADWSGELARMSFHWAVNYNMSWVRSFRRFGKLCTSDPTRRKIGTNDLDSGARKTKFRRPLFLYSLSNYWPPNPGSMILRCRLCVSAALTYD